MEQLQERALVSAAWGQVFGDSAAEIADFYNKMGDGVQIVSLYSGTRLAAAAHVLQVGQLALPGGQNLSLCQIYAVLTLPKFRGLGFGARVTNDALQKAEALGFAAAAITPATQPLFDFYARKTGCVPYFWAQQWRALPGCTVQPSALIARITPEQYAAMREKLLCGRVHGVHDLRSLRYMESLCEGFFSLTVGEETGVFAAQLQPETVFCPEFLAPGPLFAPAVGAICAAFQKPACTLRFPVDMYREGTAGPFAMLPQKQLPGLKSPLPPWLGFAFE